MNETNSPNPLVSIIIPVYNPGIFLRQAIQSVYAQTYTNWELLIVDDNSSEDISAITAEFPRAKYIRQDHGGVSVARNNGILNSSGAYIAFMDQDDLWRSEKIERQVSALSQAADAAICFCDLELISGDVKFSDLQKNEITAEVKSKDDLAKTKNSDYLIELDGSSSSSSSAEFSKIHLAIRFFSSKFIVPSTVMLRRSCLATSGLLDPFIPFAGDYDLLIKIGSRHKVIRVPRCDVFYRKHSNNFSDQYQVGRNEVDALVSRYSSYAKSKGDKKLIKEVKNLFKRPSKLYAAQAVDCARVSLSSRDYKSFFRHLAWAIRFNPWFVLHSIFTWIQNKSNRK